MGIPGLTTYIETHSDQYLEPYELHDTYLVIDGNSIASLIYNLHTPSDSAFGGDYDTYAVCVRKFFDDFIKCKIVPLVLFDGGSENRKDRTIYQRLGSKMKLASEIKPSGGKKFLPLFKVQVFQDVMDEKGVRYAQCAFEADKEIAAVARILKCPVLSYDSDFFIYGTLYVPYKTIDGVVKSQNTDGYVTKCKIHHGAKFWNSFGGLDRSLLPLVATLLGNDYIEWGEFKQFFNNIRPTEVTGKTWNESQRNITALLNWLKSKSFTLNSAVAGVLRRIQISHRRTLLTKMEQVINGYSNLFPSMLVPLGFSKKYEAAKWRSRKVAKTFKFQGDINNLETIEESENHDDDLESNDKTDNDNDDDEEISNESDEADPSIKNPLSSIAPPWFIVKYHTGQLPSYFIDMMCRQLYVFSPQIENYSMDSAHEMSLKIVGLIFKLLTSRGENVNKNLEYVLRDGTRWKRNQLPPCREKFSFNLPLLKDLSTLSDDKKAEILIHILEIPDEFSTYHVPLQWRLYLATIFYWKQQCKQPLVTNCHIYSLMCAMLFGVIDEKIRFWRFSQEFTTEYDSKIQRQSMAFREQNTSNTNITHAYESVTVEDCLIAARFFMSSFNLKSGSFNVTIIHSFAQFQSCLKHSMHLNALLGYPFVQPKVGEIYNGTWLYKLYKDFEEQSNVATYMNLKLKDSPTLLVLLNSLFNVFTCKVSLKGERKNNNNLQLSSNATMSRTSEDNSSYPDLPFSTSESRFNALNSSAVRGDRRRGRSSWAPTSRRHSPWATTSRESLPWAQTAKGTHPGRQPQGGTHRGRQPQGGAHPGRQPRGGAHPGRQPRGGTHPERQPQGGAHPRYQPQGGAHPGHQTFRTRRS